METQMNGTATETIPVQPIQAAQLPAPPTLKWDMSPDCASLFAALAKAQGEIHSASKSAENPHFKSRYADLDAVWDACREPLSKNGLAVIQMPRTWAKEEIFGVTLRALLTHASGQWISCELTMEIADLRPQTVGSAITYARRYTLAPLVGVAPGDDDDGEGAEGRNGGRQPAQRGNSVPKGQAPANGPRTSSDASQTRTTSEAPQGSPMTAETNRRITKIAESMQRPAWWEMCDRLAGCKPPQLTEEGAKKILASWEAKHGSVA